jgi:hypothetical protein
MKFIPEILVNLHVLIPPEYEKVVFYVLCVYGYATYWHLNNLMDLISL